MADLKISDLTHVTNPGRTAMLEVEIPGSPNSSGYSSAAELIASAGRETLAANRTYYVRTDGSDSNTGLADNSGGAFATIAKAVAVALALDLSIYNVTIQVRDGTYSTGIVTLNRITGSGGITILGNTANPENVIIEPTSTYAFLAYGSGWTINGVRFNRASGTSLSCFRLYGCIVDGVNLQFGDGFSYSFILCDALAQFQLSGACSVDGDCPRFGHVSGNGVINKVSSGTLTMVGTPAFATAFIQATSGAVVSFLGAASITGAATGKKFDATYNAVINYTSGVANLPGDVTGTTSTGGQAA